jgi:hypothetical protein
VPSISDAVDAAFRSRSGGVAVGGFALGDFGADPPDLKRHPSMLSESGYFPIVGFRVISVTSS